MKISILGAGSFGSALAQVVKDAGFDPIVWTYSEDSKDYFLSDKNKYICDEFKTQINITTNINDIKDSKYIFVVVPSFALRETAQKINHLVSEETIIVQCSKGIERETFKTGKTIFQEELGPHQFAILSGPSHAEEIAKRIFTGIVITSTSETICKNFQQAFSTNYFRIYTNTDVEGVELAGCIKNILAIAAGYCDASEEFGDNTKALILTRGIRELKILIELYGGNPQTAYGLTGIGDLIVTACSKHSRNRLFGELIGSGLSIETAKKEVGMVVEGYYSIQAIHQLIEKANLDLPVMEIVYNAIFKEVDIARLSLEASKRDLKSED